MKKIYWLWGICSILFYVVLYYVIALSRYLYIDEYTYLKIADYDTDSLAFIYVSFGFMGILLLIYGVIALFKKDWLHKRFLLSFILLPTYPAIMRLTLLIYEVLNRNDVRNFNIGSAFINKFHAMYPMEVSSIYVEDIGASASYGGGLFLTIFMFLSIIFNTWAVYYVYHRKFIKDYY